MGTLYVVKTFGRYHFFKSYEAREAYLATLPEWESKLADCYEVRFGRIN